jgi:hypothetical protein
LIAVLSVLGWKSTKIDLLFARQWLSEVELTLIMIQTSQVVDGSEGLWMGITQ